MQSFGNASLYFSQIYTALYTLSFTSGKPAARLYRLQYKGTLRYRTYSLEPEAVVIRRVTDWCVRGATCPKSSPSLAPGNRRVPKAESVQHPAFLPLFEQLQLTQAGQAGLQPLLIPTALSFHGQRERREHESKRAW